MNYMSHANDLYSQKHNIGKRLLLHTNVRSIYLLLSSKYLNGSTVFYPSIIQNVWRQFENYGSFEFTYLNHRDCFTISSTSGQK